MKFHFFSKKITRRSKTFVKFILEGKWSFGIISYTLSRAKSNGTIHFVLSLKFGDPCSFPQTPQKTYIFYATRFIYGLEKIFTNKNIFSKGFLHVLFRSFFSKLYNKNFELKSLRSPWHDSPPWCREKVMVYYY